jgi:hypothetical protein
MAGYYITDAFEFEYLTRTATVRPGRARERLGAGKASGLVFATASCGSGAASASCTSGARVVCAKSRAASRKSCCSLVSEKSIVIGSSLPVEDSLAGRMRSSQSFLGQGGLACSRRPRPVHQVSLIAQRELDADALSRARKNAQLASPWGASGPRTGMCRRRRDHSKGSPGMLLW